MENGRKYEGVSNINETFLFDLKETNAGDFLTYSPDFGTHSSHRTGKFDMLFS